MALAAKTILKTHVDPDAVSTMAEAFFRALLAGRSPGEALLDGRLALKAQVRPPEEWAAHVLFGAGRRAAVLRCGGGVPGQHGTTICNAIAAVPLTSCLCLGGKLTRSLSSARFPMAASLSSHDVARLMSEPSPDLRVELAGKVAADLSDSGLTAAEVKLAQDIVRVLARDVEEKVRASLSRGLRHSPDLPRDVALKLADDIDYVALPMLADSLVLTDEDLIEIVHHGSSLKQEAVASRANLTETVSDALITYAEEPAVVVLMSNNTASIAEDSFDRAVTRFAGSDRVKEAMVLRDKLPIAVAERLVTMVSKALQTHLVRAHDLAPATAANIVLTSREHAIIHLSMGASDEELRHMVTQMQRNGRLTPSLILRALCTGDIAFFEAAMAAKSDVPLDNAQILIHEASRRGRAALYRKAAMPDALFSAFQAAVDVVDETGFDGEARDLERFRSRVITRILTLVDTVDPADADYLLDKLGDVLVHAPAGGAVHAAAG